MGRTANITKQRWNAEHYTQIKVYIEPELASEFKEACVSAQTSITSVFTQFIRGFCHASAQGMAKPEYNTRRKRRAALKRIAQQIQLIRDAEDAYLCRIPENLQGASVYDNAEHAVSMLDEAIDHLLMAY